MREVPVTAIADALARMAPSANQRLPADVIGALEAGLAREESPTGRRILEQILENDRLAADEGLPACQDTGLAVVFLEVGQRVALVGGDLMEAAHEGVRRGYRDGFLRKSTCHPFTRKNVGDNTPAVVHLTIVPGDRVRVVLAPKGGGSENMSTVKMLKPSQGREGVKQAVIEWVIGAGGNPCPPSIVGVGIGGNFERSAYLAKRALLRPVGQASPDPDLAALEAEILTAINASGVGPMGLGGLVTALAVHVDMEPCHIASFPLAINVQCHAARHEEVVL